MANSLAEQQSFANVEKKALACLDLAQAYFGKSFRYEKIELNLRGRAAGQIRYYRASQRPPVLRFNKQLLMRYGDRFVEEVVPHEVAHLIAYSHYGSKIKPHGKEWKFVMCQVLGMAAARVTHDFDVAPARRLQYFDYRCQCLHKRHRLSVIRHGKVKRGVASYLCRACKEPLAPV